MQPSRVVFANRSSPQGPYSDAVVLDTLGTAHELAQKVTHHVAPIVADPATRHLPFPQTAVSDHLTTYFELNGLTFVSLNVLNQMWMKYLTQEPNDQQQRLDHMPFVVDTPGSRMNIILGLVRGWLAKGRIILLQEVDYILYRAICNLVATAQSPFVCFSSRERFNKETGIIDNRNLTIVPANAPAHFCVTEVEADALPEDVTGNHRVKPLRFSIADSPSYDFILVNAHLNFSRESHAKNAAWASAYATKHKCSVIIGGDFNATNRIVDGKQIVTPIREVYDAPNMRLGLPNPSRGLCYSHANVNKNTAGAHEQLDLFDNFLVVNPPA